jgi:hypothetical protein
MRIPHHWTIMAAAAAVCLGCRPQDREQAREDVPANPESTSSASRAAANPDLRCAPDGALIELPDVPEASNLAASVRTPGIFWTSNDNGEPVVYAVDSTGAIRGRVRVSGAKVKNWEALAVGSCTAGSCLYIGDIGDNKADRKSITVYRVPEPLPGDSATVEAQAFHATYPNGPQDAEAMWVTAKREVYIVTKGETGNISVYRFPPATAQNGATVELEMVVKLEGRDPKRREMVTDASLSADGRQVAMRSKSELMIYGAPELLAGRPTAPTIVDLRELGEPQGEGVTFGPDGSLYLAGEGGGKGLPGTLVALRCQDGHGSKQPEK